MDKPCQISECSFRKEEAPMLSLITCCLVTMITSPLFDSGEFGKKDYRIFRTGRSIIPTLRIGKERIPTLRNNNGIIVYFKASATAVQS